MDISTLLSQDILSSITAVVSLASAAATVLPTPKSNGTYKLIYGALQWIGMNFGKAKNAQDQKTFTFER